MKKTLLYYMALVAIVLAAIEILSFTYLAISVGRPVSKIPQVLLEAAGQEAQNAAKPVEKRDIIGHPYYGYVHDANNALPDTARHVKASNLGLHGDSELLKEYYDDVCNVAVIGGSVANIFYAHEHDSLRKFFAGLPENAGKTVNVFGFTNWGYKQPQQMLIVLDLIAQGAHFDYVINIDGLNEVAIPLGNNLPNNVYPFFPVRWDLATRDAQDTSYADDKGRLRGLTAIQGRVAAAYRDLILRPYTVRAAYWVCHKFYESAKAKLVAQLAHASVPLKVGNNLTLNESGGQMVNSSKPLARNVLPWLVLQWARASALLHNAVIGQEGKYFHVLQPNQYLPGGKPFTEHEASAYVNAANPLSSLVPKFYPLLRRAGETLRHEGVLYADFSMIFQNTKEELYINDCCHFNKLGNDLFESRLEDMLLKERKNSDAKRPVNIAATARRVLEDPELRREFYADYSLDFDLFHEDPDLKVDNILPQENPSKLERWAQGARHGVGFFSADKRRMTLDASFLTVLPGQRVRFSLNGRELPWSENLIIARHPFDYDALNSVRLTFETSPGWNTLSITCDRHDPNDRDFSILYTKFALTATR